MWFQNLVSKFFEFGFKFLVSDSYEKALASFFGSGPTDLEEAKQQHLVYVSKLRELGLKK